MDYKDREKAECDIKQCILNPDGSVSKNPRKYAKQIIEKDFTLVVMCPFCLNTTELWRFNFIRGLRRCPNCLNQMRLETLIKIKSLTEFVKFVFNYRLEGFWNKVYPSFDEWNKKLYGLHLNREFWEEYKKLKGDSNKNYEEGD
jgi:hypothetical protein